MQSTQPNDIHRLPKSPAGVRRVGSRAVVLSAAAMAVAAGAFGTAQVIPFNAAKAQPIAPTVQAFPSFADVIERVRDAVVSVKVIVADTSNSPEMRSFGNAPVPRMQPGDPLERFFRQFGQRGQNFGPRSRVRRAQGSGFIISEDGYVVTNNHVVKNARKVQLTFDGGKTVEAHVVGTDEKTDLALLKINEGGKYKYVTFAKKLPRVGDWVVAVGNPFGLGGTVTAGIVSARGRDIGSGPYDDFLQIDAPVNRGNSGGPTFNSSGEVVGVNTAIYSPSGGSVGIGFAIPANVVQNVVTALRDKGVVSRGYIGVQIQPVTKDIAESMGVKERSGALVASATAGLPAEKAGLRAGDIITSVNGEPVASPRVLARKIAAIKPGVDVKIGYVRDGRNGTVTLKLASQPGGRKASLENRGPNSGSSNPTVQRFGMTLAPASDVAGAGSAGIVVAEIDPSGLAARQGLRSGDVILEAGGKKVVSPTEFKDIVSTARGKGNKAVLLRVKSGSTTRFVALSLRNRDAG
ncbi:MAG: Do family serine endopeptidase [Hyphomicrobiales bacterium]|nr:Do family serine endopeptidase [Hyphomicrobiales bacterium]